MQTNQFPTELSVSSCLVLRELEEANADVLFRTIDRNRLYLREWLPWLDSVRETKDTLTFIEEQQRLRRDLKEITFGIFVRGEFAGIIATHALDWANHRTTLGYWLAADFTGRGIMTQSCNCLVNHLFTSLEFHRVAIHCAVSNTRSRAIPVRLGFFQEGILRESEWLYDRHLDQVIYSLLSTDSATALPTTDMTNVHDKSA